MVMLKFQHMQHVPMYPGGPPMPFDQPVMQALFMMVGETLCLPVWLWSRQKAADNSASSSDDDSRPKGPVWVFIVPCCCDLVATALVCAGLAYIAVSIAQICRGTIVVFVCGLSAIFLGRRQLRFHLVGVACVTFGILVVAFSAFRDKGLTSSDATKPGNQLGTGILLCIFAQIFQASMFVYEEKIMKQYVVQPLQVVAMEGLWGVSISVAVLSALTGLGVVDTRGAIHQIQNSTTLFYSTIGSMVAVALFNFAGATVTQRSSATARTTIKISSTICIWIVELAAGWNKFSFGQLVGFVFVALGTLLYNRIIVLPILESPDEMALVKREGK
jgi:drug/metabolite transporter (DMT)-like permease